MPFRAVRHPRGFTMVELIVVLLISSILLTIGTAVVWRQIQDRRDAEVERTLQAIDTSARQMAQANGEADPSPYLQPVADDVRLSADEQANGWGVQSVDATAGLLTYEHNGICGALLTDPAGEPGRIGTWDCDEPTPEWADTSPSCPSPPAAPTAPSASAGSEAGQLDVTWQDPDTDLAGYVVTVTGPGDGEGIYRVRDRDGSEPSGFRTAMTLSGLSPGVTYTVEVASVRAGQCQSSAVSTTGTAAGDSASPEAPTAQVVTSVGRAEVSWTRVDGASAYEVARDGSPVGTTERDWLVDDGGSSLPEGTYSWTVTPLFGEGPGVTSAPVSAFVPGTPGTPGPPMLTEGDFDGDGDDPDVRISWAAVSGATDYVVHHCNGDGCKPTTVVATVNGATTTTDHLDVREGLNRYTVTAVTDLFGSNASGISEIEIAGVPDPPTGLSAVTGDLNDGNGVHDDVAVSWDAVTGATSYELFFCAGPSCAPETLLASPAGTTFDHHDLDDGTYRYAVAAVTPQGTTGLSAPVSVTVDLLAAPENLQAVVEEHAYNSDGSHDDISLTFDAVADATGYDIFRCKGAGCTPSAHNSITSTSVGYINMSEGVWRFAVRADDGTQKSKLTAVVEAEVIPGWGMWATAADTDPDFQTGKLAYAWFDATGWITTNGAPRLATEMDALFTPESPGVAQGGAGLHTTSIEWWGSSGTWSHDKPGYLPAYRYGWTAHGYLYAPEAGDYTFGVDSDDASDLWVDGNRVAHWYNGHGPAGDGTGPNFAGGGVSETLHLAAGWHPIVARHMNGTGGEGFAVGWQPPGASGMSTIPAANFGLPAADVTLPPAPVETSGPDFFARSGKLATRWYDVSNNWNGHPTSRAEFDQMMVAEDTVAGAPSTLDTAIEWWPGAPNAWTYDKPAYLPDYYYIWVADGHIYAPTSGTYRFSVDVDDVADLIINDTVVVHRYPGEGSQASSGGPNYNHRLGAITLEQGWHDFTVRMENGTGGAGFAVGWQKPGDASDTFATIPRNNFALPAQTVDDGHAVGGLTYEWFDATTVYNDAGINPGNTTQLDDWFDPAAGAVKKGSGSHTTTVAWWPGAPNDWPEDKPAYLQDTYYSWRLTGHVYAPSDGTYTFAVDSDDGADLWIGGTQVATRFRGQGPLATDAGPAFAPENSGTITLTAGWHPITARYQNGHGGEGFALGWQRPGDSRISVISPSAFGVSHTPVPADPRFNNGEVFTTTYDTTNRHSLSMVATSTTGQSGMFSVPGTTLQDERILTGSPWWKYGTSAWGQAKPSHIQADNYSWSAHAWLWAPTDGVYTFGVDSAGPSDVTIDGRVVAAWYGGHGDAGASVGPNYPGSKTGQAYLTVGWHQIDVRYNEGSGSQESISVGWQPPGAATLSAIPSSHLATLKANDVLGDDQSGIRVNRHPRTVDVSERVSRDYTTTGMQHRFDVPGRVSNFVIHTWGAKGGGGAGGEGGYMRATYPVGYGDTLWLLAGQRGGGPGNGSAGYGGGGKAGGAGTVGAGGGGGGYSDARLNGTHRLDRIIVGGGGGGVGKWHYPDGSSRATAGGGPGGYSYGSDGGGQAPGIGGTQTGGGAGGVPSNCSYRDNGMPGWSHSVSHGPGGEGGYIPNTYGHGYASGGGGGGGYYGGGGGGASQHSGCAILGGGGGGSNYYGSGTNVAWGRGINNGGGFVRLVYDWTYATPLLRDFNRPQIDGVSSDRIFVPYNPIMDSDTLTVDATVTWDGPQSGGADIIVNREPIVEVGVSRDTGRLQAAIRTTAGWGWIGPDYYLTPDVETRVRVVYDGTNILFYADGQHVGTEPHPYGGPIGNDYNPGAPMEVGARANPTSYRQHGAFNGTLEDVIVSAGAYMPPGTGTETFGFVGAPQTFTVPDDVTELDVILCGAAGGGGAEGGCTSGTLATTPGETLHLFVGGMGADPVIGSSSGNGAPGGWNGGASGGDADPGGYPGGGGGGATDIRRGSTTLAGRIAVAGGGGGAARGDVTWTGDNAEALGGRGGTATAEDGEQWSSRGYPGSGGTTSSGNPVGGTGGSSFYGEREGADGSPGNGGRGGGAESTLSANFAGGGGGGGYAGGGGGAGAGSQTGGGGGGGSSYADELTDATMTLGGNAADGYITLSW